ncbi:MAG: sugar phosphate isomerase/epimerase [Bryobacterales bacterium]|nr:sugar phosphate isomerase/epimerase [Bryobacterales bacterium]
MHHVLSTHLFVNHRLTTVWLEKIRQAGIPAVEIFCARQHLDHRDQAQVRELSHWFRDSPLKLWSLHAPMYTDDVWGRSGPQSVITITEPVKAKRVEMVDELKRALEIAEFIPFRYLIQHIGVGGEEYDERKIEAAFTSLEELSLFARHRGVEILVENIPNHLSTSERLMMFLAQTHLPLNICFDMGHANLEGSVEVAFERMKARIRSTHIHDNDGTSDTHIFPVAGQGGSIDWKKAMQLLNSASGQYPLLLELKEVPGMSAPVDEAARVFEELEKLSGGDAKP